MSVDRKGSLDPKIVPTTPSRPHTRGQRSLGENFSPEAKSRLDNLRTDIFNLLMDNPYGRSAVAAVIGFSSLPMVLATNVDAELDPNYPCVQVGYDPDTISKNEGTKLIATVNEECRASVTKSGVIGLEAVFFNPSFSIGGRSPLEYGVLTVNLRDDGINDTQANDGKFESPTIKIAESTNLPTMRPVSNVPGVYQEELFDPAIKVNFSDGSFRYYRVPELYVIEESLLSTPITRISDTLQITQNTINVRSNSGVVGTRLRHKENGWEDVKTIFNEVYQAGSGADMYDFLTVMDSRRMYLRDNVGTINAVAGVSSTIRRDFKGVGLPEDTIVRERVGLDKLKTTIFIDKLEPTKLIPHELMHRWATYLPESLGLNDKRGHWKKNNSAGGLVEGIGIQDNKDGTYTSLGDELDTASDAELYFAGLKSPGEVSPIVVLDNATEKMRIKGTVYNGSSHLVTIEDIIKEVGPRIPGADTAQRNFDMGVIYLTQGRVATKTEMARVNSIAAQIPLEWNRATKKSSTIRLVTPFTNKDTQKSIIKPENGTTLPSYEIPLQSNLKDDAKWAHVQLVPAGGDGPGIDNLYGDPKVLEDIKKGEYKILAPDLQKGSFIALPDMGYALRVKTSSLLNPQDPSGWSDWSQVQFRTPKASSDTISLSNVLAAGNKKVLTWNNSDPNIFYNEVQVSGDTRFDPYPESATSFVWWNLVHAGQTNPKNSWTTPDLDPGTYYWRVRPRVQGDGLQVPWTSAGSFTVGASSNK